MSDHKPILVIGGGPAGMEATRGIAELGYKAVLIEKRDVLGGTPELANYAALTPDFRDAGEAIATMVGAIENVGLAKRLPLGTALRMTLQGRDFRLPAERAWQIGLVDELVESPADVLPAALEIAQSLLKNSPQAMALSKQAVWGAVERGYGDALEAAWGLLRLHWSHPDFAEGPRAFAEKREPRWNPDPNARAEDEE